MLAILSELYWVEKIFGPMREVGLYWGRINHELDHLVEKTDIMRFAKSERLRWIGLLYAG